jgi:hypothetical protein
MPYTVRVRATLARYLLGVAYPDLRRRIDILRANPFPPGSRSLDADADWGEFAQAFPTKQGFVYGSRESAIVYTYEARTSTLLVEFAVRAGRVVGRSG